MARTKAELDKIINRLPTDKGTLNEDQLNEALTAYNELGSLPETTIQGQDLNQYFVRQLGSKIQSSYGIALDQGALNDLATYSVNALKSGNYNPQEVVNRIIQHIGGRADKEGGLAGALLGERRNDTINTAQNIARDIPVDYTREVQSGQYETQTQGPGDYSKQIGEIQGFLTPLTQKRQSEEAINKYLTDLPGQSLGDIDTLQKALESSQSEYFQNFTTPGIVSSLNARGLAHSGDLTSSLAEASAAGQRNITNLVAPLRTQATSDARNKNYENLVRQAINSGRDVDSAISFARGLQAQDSQNQFTASQADLARSFSSDQFNQYQALQLALNNGKSKPGALDYFLQYGLPVLSQAGSSLIGAKVK